MHAAHLHWLAEHDALAAVLQAVSFLGRRLPKSRQPEDLRALRAMLVYVGGYPERVHHPREEAELFDRLWGRDVAVDAALDRLKSEHALTMNAVRDLEHLLNVAEFGDNEDGEVFAGSAERFVGAYHAHMQLEETIVLPQAERLLTPAEWQSIHVSLIQERDPLHGTPRDAEFELLFSTIVRLTPAPLGLGNTRA